MNPLGTVFADNVEDPESLDSIRFGLIKGMGLLGEVVTAVHKLIEAENDVYYEGYITEKMRTALYEQRVNFYETLKAIERTES